MRGDWLSDAGCRYVGFDFFFAESGNYDLTREAVSICRGCSVRAECLDYAMSMEDGRSGRFGVWGGLTSRQRAQLATRRKEGSDPTT